MKMDEGQFSVAVCEDIVASSVWADTWGDGEVVEFWSAKSVEGSGVPITRGTILSASSIQDLFGAVELSEPVFTKNTRLEVAVLNATPKKSNFVAGFDLRGHLDDGDQWLHPDGTSTDEPCKPELVTVP
ncbi:hypothetical protein ACX3O0_01655 [Homoserinimonas sp. A447]